MLLLGRLSGQGNLHLEAAHSLTLWQVDVADHQDLSWAVG